jgi:hypothetical protein
LFPLVTRILLSTPFSVAFNISSSLRVAYRVSHQGKTIFLSSDHAEVLGNIKHEITFMIHSHRTAKLMQIN